MPALAFFCEQKRRLPKLCRGWRTPDPSPTRDAAGLPRCAPSEICVGDEVQKTPRQADVRRTLTDQTHYTAQARTPSPPSIVFDWAPELEELESSVMTSEASWSRCNDDGIAHGSVVSTSSGNAGDDTSAFHAGACNAPVVVLSMIDASEMPGTPPEDSRSDACAVSVGSVGHPYTCSKPCKYFSKRRGCLDGAQCDHCHLCDWKPGRKPHSKKERRAARTLSGEPTSIESATDP